MKQPSPTDRLRAVTTELYYEHFSLAEDLAREVMANLGAQFDEDATRMFLTCVARRPVEEGSELARLVDYVKEWGPEVEPLF